MKRLIPLCLLLIGLNGCAGYGYYPSGYGFGGYGPGYYPPYGSYSAYCSHCYHEHSVDPNVENYYKSKWVRKNVSNEQYKNYLKRQYPDDYYKSQWARKNISSKQYKNYMRRKYR